MSMHIDAAPGEIAKRVLLPGDPDRAKYVAEKYLTSARCVNQKRGMLCFTGEYAGKEVSVMATGMGVPSMLIYATELYRDYGCEAMIRVGTSAGYRADMQLHDVVLSQAACTTSGINSELFGGSFAPIADYELLETAHTLAGQRGLRSYVGNTVCNDRLYRHPDSYRGRTWAKYGVLCSEMEGAGLYTAAAEFGKRALTMVSIISLIRFVGEQEEFYEAPDSGGKIDDMLLLALDAVTKIELED